MPSLSRQIEVVVKLHKYILNLIQAGTCIQASDEAVLIDGTGLPNTMTEKRMAETIRGRRDAKLNETMDQLPEIRFANLGVDAGTVHNLKTIVSPGR
jgi:hypothetical protein